MSGDEWPADPADPRCPECSEPVSATASYCMHCEADLPTGADDEGSVSVATVSTDAGSVEQEGEASAGGQPAADDAADDEGLLGHRTGEDGAADATPDRERATPVEDAGAPAAGGAAAGAGVGDDDERGWLHPDSTLDDVSTGAVGLVGGFVAGFLAMVLALLTTGSGWGFLVGPVVWVAAGLYVGWTRSVFGAVRKATYVTAVLLVALPLFWFGETPQGGDVAGRVVAFVISEVVAVPVAALLAGVGYWLGGKAPDDA